VIDALSSLLLVAGFALLLGAFVFFPPFGLAAFGTGATVLVPTVTTGFVAMTTLGVTGIALSHAAGNAGDAGGRPRRLRHPDPLGAGHRGPPPDRGVPDIPQRPPRPMPQVRHPRLRNIIDQLWHGHRSSGRVGDGTTMDAIRNEMLTGRQTGNSWHIDKGFENIRALERFVVESGGEATQAERALAWRLRNELARVLWP